MAKGQGGNEDRAKVKLRVIEFELEGGNQSVENSIRQLTHALTMRNGQPAPPKNALPPRQTKELGAVPDNEDEAEEFAEEPEILESGADDNGATKVNKPKAKSTYKPRVPQYLHDLDMTGTGDVTFKDFAAAKNPKKNTQRHLVAAFWLKEHGNNPTINIDKAYTCYRNVGWPTTQPDWDVNFRQQTQNNRFRRVAPGEYSINPPGEDDVRKMNGTE